MAAHMRFNWAGLSVGISYDFNVSSLSVATLNNGGPEIMLMWRGKFASGNKPESKTTNINFL